MLLQFLFGGLLFYAAYQDKIKLKVSHIVIALMWFFLYCLGLSDPSVLIYAVGTFSLLFIVSLLYQPKGKEIIGFADVLIIPVFAAFLKSFLTIEVYVLFFVLGVLSPYVAIRITKEERLAAVPYLLFFYFFALINHVWFS